MRVLTKSLTDFPQLHSPILEYLSYIDPVQQRQSNILMVEVINYLGSLERFGFTPASTRCGCSHSLCGSWSRRGAGSPCRSQVLLIERSIVKSPIVRVNDWEKTMVTWLA